MCATIFPNFPYSFYAILSAIIGNVLYSFDLLKITKFMINKVKVINPEEEPSQTFFDAIEEPRFSPLENLNHSDSSVDSNIQSLVSMGFSEEQSRNALQASNGDIEAAVGMLVDV